MCLKSTWMDVASEMLKWAEQAALAWASSPFSPLIHIQCKTLPNRTVHQREDELPPRFQMSSSSRSIRFLHNARKTCGQPSPPMSRSIPWEGQADEICTVILFNLSRLAWSRRAWTLEIFATEAAMAMKVDYEQFSQWSVWRQKTKAGFKKQVCKWVLREYGLLCDTLEIA